MGGWRDVDGKTTTDRRRTNAESERRSFLATVRHRPTSLVKPVLGFVFILVLVFTLILALR
jgi:hypothetical protein